MNGAGHYREALASLDAAKRRGGQSDELGGIVYGLAALTHATLAAAAEPEPMFEVAAGDPPWTLEDVTEMATELRELRAAVRPALGYLDQTPGGRAVAVELRKLVR